jgi:hypothetical protein
MGMCHGPTSSLRKPHTEREEEGTEENEEEDTRENSPRPPCLQPGASGEDRLKDRLGDQRGGSEWEPIKILLGGD